MATPTTEPRTAHALARELLAGPDLPVVVEVGDPVSWEQVNRVEYRTTFFFTSDVTADSTTEPAVRLTCG